MSKQAVTVEAGNYLIVRYDGGVRSISEEEIREMTRTDRPVEVR